MKENKTLEDFFKPDASQVDGGDLPIVDPPVDEGQDKKDVVEASAEDVEQSDTKVSQPEQIEGVEAQPETAIDGGDDDDYKEALSILYGEIASKAGIEDDDTPDTFEAIVDKLSGIIKEGSVKYASPLSEAFDSYVRAGGDLQGFYDQFVGGDSMMDTKTDEGKIRVITSVLKDAGFSDMQISRKIEAYIENDTLDSEAEDAVSVLQAKREKESAAKVAMMREEAERERKEAEQFYMSIANTINDTNEIYGVPLTPADKKALSKYMLEINKATGMSRFQEEYDKSIMPLIASAFFTMSGKSLIKKAEAKGSSDIKEKFKKAIRTTRVSKSASNHQVGPDLSPWIKAGSFLVGS